MSWSMAVCVCSIHPSAVALDELSQCCARHLGSLMHGDVDEFTCPSVASLRVVFLGRDSGSVVNSVWRVDAVLLVEMISFEFYTLAFSELVSFCIEYSRSFRESRSVPHAYAHA